MENNYLLFISLAYLFIGFIDLLHTLSYAGMNIFRDYDFYANQLWIAARYTEAFTLLAGFLFIGSRRKINVYAVLALYAALTALVTLSVFTWKIFPICFIQGKGLTPFKVYSEYIISGILLATAYLLYRHKSSFRPKVYSYMMYSIIYTIVAELAFTFYISNYGISNLVGHYFKIFSFYCIYRSVIVTGIEEPQQTIFKELVDKENMLVEANRTKDKLFSILMHDMRGPITALHDFMHDAKYNFDSYTREDIKLMIDAGHESVSIINRLLGNMYTWIRTQSEHIKPDIKTYKMSDLVRDSLRPYKTAAETKKIELAVDISPELEINTDREIFKAIVRNLINNSVKFSHQGGKISVSAEIDIRCVKLSISDNGVGIGKEHLDKLFDMNTKYTSRGTSNEQGSGFGLKICKDLSELLGATLTIESTHGSGTRATLTICAQNVSSSR